MPTDNRTDEMEAVDLITHQQTELSRLTSDRDKALAQVRAEQAHNTLLVKACGFYRSAACTVLGFMREVSAQSGEDNSVSQVGADAVIQDVANDIDRADKILLPTVE